MYKIFQHEIASAMDKVRSYGKETLACRSEVILTLLFCEETFFFIKARRTRAQP